MCHHFLAGKASRQALGEDFGAGLSAAEVDYLMEREWAHHPQDILWRRTKLALHLSEQQVARLASYMQAKRRQAQAV